MKVKGDKRKWSKKQFGIKKYNVERTLLKIEMNYYIYEIRKENLYYGTFRKQKGILKIKKYDRKADKHQ